MPLFVLQTFYTNASTFHYSIHICSQLMRPSCYMASIDLWDGYYSVPVAKEHQKYLKFIWQGNPYQFTCLAQGLFRPPVSSPNL